MKHSISIVALLLAICFYPHFGYAQSSKSIFNDLISICDSLILTQSHTSIIRANELLNAFRSSDDFERLNCAEKGNYYYKLGINLYYLKNNDLALEYFRDSAFIARADCQLILPGDLVNNHRILARLNFRAGNNQRGIVHLKSAIGLLPKAKNTSAFVEAGLYKELAIVYRNLDDFDKSIELLLKSIDLYKNVPIAYLRNQANALKELGEIYNRVGHYKLASSNLRQALGIYKSIQSTNQEEVLSNIYYLLSTNAKDQGNYDQGLLFADTMELYIPEIIEEEYLTALLKEVRARIFFRKKEFKNSLGIFKELLKQDLVQLDEYNQADILAIDYENIGDVYTGMLQYSLATHSYNKAIHYLLLSYDTSSYHTSPHLGDQVITHRPILLRILQLKAKMLYHQYRMNSDIHIDKLYAAYDHYRVMDTLIFQVRKSFKADGSKYHLSKIFRSVYVEGIECSKELYEITSDPSYLHSAYHFASTYKSAVLQERLHNAELNYGASMPDSLTEIKRILDHKIDALGREVHTAGLRHYGTLDSLELVLIRLKNNRDILIEQMDNEYPAIYHDKFTYWTQMNADDVRGHIPESTALVEYVFGEKKVYIFYLSKLGIRLFEKAIDSTFNNTVETLTRSLRDISFLRDHADQAEQDFLWSSSALYEVLVRPIHEKLMTDKVNRLIIIPDGILSYVPFEALSSSKASSWLDIENTMLSAYAIRYLPSNHWLLSGDQNQSSSFHLDFGGYGIEYDEETLDDMRSLNYESFDSKKSFEGFRDGMTNLLYANEEVIGIKNTIEGDAWLNEEATRENFIENSSKYRILHIAAHGFVHSTDPDLSAIVFNRTDTMADNLLLATDVYNMSLATDLVTLSACNTGSGKLESGEGVMSISRAFHAAGAKSIVASMWSISDKTTTMLMTLFYQNLKKGLPKDIALQQAKLGYLQSASPAQRLPLYWAPFVLSGSEAPINFNHNVPIYLWIAALVLILLGLVAWKGLIPN